jgi:hypothetical protein
MRILKSLFRCEEKLVGLIQEIVTSSLVTPFTHNLHMPHYYNPTVTRKSLLPFLLQLSLLCTGHTTSRTLQ